MTQQSHYWAYTPRKPELKGWETHVHLWQIHVNVWQNHYNIIISLQLK